MNIKATLATILFIFAPSTRGFGAETPLIVMLAVEKIAQQSQDTDYLENFTTPQKGHSKAILQKREEKPLSLSERMSQSFHQKARQQQDWYRRSKDRMASEFAEKMSKMKTKYASTINYWNNKHQVFQRAAPILKENLTDFGRIVSMKPQKDTIIKRRILSPYKVIPGALLVDIRSQGARPTCASFAGIRALEVLLAQRRIKVDLSEQYFYWASKPACQSNPCSEKGSWISKAFERSRAGRNFDIPLEKNCQYSPYTSKGNETQTPLPSSCTSQGVAKVQAYRSISSLFAAKQALDRNKPIIIATKLSASFYTKNPYISETEADSGGRLDSHSNGHALTLIGYIKLPESLSQKEGNLCFIAANSWGQGWGRGGYACLTEKWLSNRRLKMDMIVAEAVSYVPR